jgi:hypothetical protein
MISMPGAVVLSTTLTWRSFMISVPGACWEL